VSRGHEVDAGQRLGARQRDVAELPIGVATNSGTGADFGAASAARDGESALRVGGGWRGVRESERSWRAWPQSSAERRRRSPGPTPAFMAEKAFALVNFSSTLCLIPSQT